MIITENNPINGARMSGLHHMKMARELVPGDVLYDKSEYGIFRCVRVFVKRVEFDGPDLCMIYCDDPKSPEECIYTHPGNLIAVETEIPAWLIAKIDDALESGFQLDRKPKVIRPLPRKNPPRLQLPLFSGLECSAGQSELFSE